MDTVLHSSQCVLTTSYESRRLGVLYQQCVLVQWGFPLFFSSLAELLKKRYRSPYSLWPRYVLYVPSYSHATSDYGTITITTVGGAYINKPSLQPADQQEPIRTKPQNTVEQGTCHTCPLCPFGEKVCDSAALFFFPKTRGSRRLILKTARVRTPSNQP